MTEEEVRSLALSLPEAAAHPHFNRTAFRAGNGKIFATLGSPNADHGMVALLPEQQELAIEAQPEAFRPAAGAWGRGGSTLVALECVSEEWLERALHWAWEKRAQTKRSV